MKLKVKLRERLSLAIGWLVKRKSGLFVFIRMLRFAAFCFGFIPDEYSIVLSFKLWEILAFWIGKIWKKCGAWKVRIERVWKECRAWKVRVFIIKDRRSFTLVITFARSKD